MTRFQARTRRRAGFTLVEVMVVVAIIAILVSLTAAAVFKVIGKGDELKARKDMSDLQLAIENFKAQFKVNFVPSRFRLRENLPDYIAGINAGDSLDIDSWAYLKQLFPKLSSAGQIDWNGNGVLDQAVDLEGHQCLIFFLGGIPSYNPNTCLGFSTNPSNPAFPFTLPAGPPQAYGDRLGPYYGDFVSDRLVILQTNPVGTVGGAPAAVQNTSYFSYLDAWGKPSDLAQGITPVYGYLSSYAKTNGYNRYYQYYINTGAGVTSDCSSLVVEDYQNIGNPTQGLWPYAQKVNLPQPQYVSSTSYQIFTAGKNKVFGQGTRLVISGSVYTTTSYTWTSQTAGQVSPLGQDDFSNFYDRMLGSGD
jgi:prepilin-type N-terminal cleavage/methylation domain-containing protein